MKCWTLKESISIDIEKYLVKIYSETMIRDFMWFWSRYIFLSRKEIKVIEGNDEIDE